MATRRAMPVLQVGDVLRSQAFYARLGFASHGPWGEPPQFVICQRGDATLAFKRASTGLVEPNEWWAAYIYVDDAAALRAEIAAEGIAPTELCEREYGLRDFDVIDPDGHRIAFGSHIAPAPHGPGLSQERGRG